MASKTDEDEVKSEKESEHIPFTPKEVFTPVKEISVVTVQSKPTFDLLKLIRSNSKEDLDKEIQSIIREDEENYNIGFENSLMALMAQLSHVLSKLDEVSETTKLVQKVFSERNKDYFITGYNRVVYDLNKNNQNAMSDLTNISQEIQAKWSECVEELRKSISSEHESAPMELTKEIEQALTSAIPAYIPPTANMPMVEKEVESMAEISKKIIVAEFEPKKEKLSVEGVFKEVDKLEANILP